MAKTPKTPKQNIPDITKLKKARKLEDKEMKDILSTMQEQVRVMQALGKETEFIKNGFNDISEVILNSMERARTSSIAYKDVVGDINKVSLENLQVGIKMAEQIDKIGTSQFRQLQFQENLYEIERLRQIFSFPRTI